MSLSNLSTFGWCWFAFTVVYVLTFIQGLAAIISPNMNADQKWIDKYTSSPLGVGLALVLLCYLMS